MAIGGVYMTDTDGNIGGVISNLSEKVCGLLFDISAQSNFWTSAPGTAAAAVFQDKVVELNSLKDAVAGGIAEFNELSATSAPDYLLNGVAYYHIKHYFDAVGGSGRLFVYFADCSTNWDALQVIQRAAKGAIGQMGVWTEQNLWKQVDSESESYQVGTAISALQTVAASLANDDNAPVSILLSANYAKVQTASDPLTTVTWSMIPSVIGSSRYVTVLLGQAADSVVSAIQTSLTSKTPVGTVGLALAHLALANVAESIGWVRQHNLNDYIQDIEFGFGDVSMSGGALVSTTNFSSLTKAQLDTLDNKGYVFMLRYAGLEGGVYYNGDQTCSDGDYRTISRNRVINKSRRLVRAALLPYVNSPIKVDPATGYLSAAQITVFTNAVSDVLQTMVNNAEVSGIGTISIPANQNILKDDKLNINYTLVPMGCSKEIDVTEGLVIKA